MISWSRLPTCHRHLRVFDTRKLGSSCHPVSLLKCHSSSSSSAWYMLAILHGRVHSLERVANSRRRGMKVKVQLGVAEPKRAPFAPRPRSRVHRDNTLRVLPGASMPLKHWRDNPSLPHDSEPLAPQPWLSHVPLRRPHARRRHCHRAERSSRFTSRRRSSQRDMQRDQRSF